MPELPEVETTVRGLQRTMRGQDIKDVWTDLRTRDPRKKDTIADPKYFLYFRRETKNKKILSVERRAKNILINLSGGKTILVHMKMTGHLLYGKYEYLKNLNRWKPSEKGPLEDPFNRFVHAVFTLSKGKHLAFSDTRKFGKITLLDTKTASASKHLNGLGPEPLEKNFKLENFVQRLNLYTNKKIKIVLMDQNVVAGIGNIYSDEILWRAGVHPECKVSEIKDGNIGKIFQAMKELLRKGIDFGGDSMSDYRNIRGRPGKFQLHHEAYRRTGEKCRKSGCRGVIMRKIINGRSAHFCLTHQK